MAQRRARTKTRRFARAIVLAAPLAAAIACGRAQPEGWGDTTPSGFAMTPTIAQRTDAGPRGLVDAPSDAGKTVHAVRPLPAEPPAPPQNANCAKEKLCREEEDDAPLYAYPAPYERCLESYGRSPHPAKFSVAETRDARRVDPTTCCYVEYHCAQL